MAINEEKLNQFLGSCVNDFGATMHAGLVVIGEKLGALQSARASRQKSDAGGISRPNENE